MRNGVGAKHRDMVNQVNSFNKKQKSMKKCLLLLNFAITTFNVVIAQSHDYYDRYTYRSVKGAYHDDLEFIVHGGVLFSNLRYGSATAIDLGIDYTPYESGDNMFSYSFVTDYLKSKDYWSINPLGSSSIILNVFCKNVIDDNETAKFMLMIMAAESMSLNFALTEHLEVSPYWNLLRLSSWQHGATYVTGAFGARANYYFGTDDKWSIRLRGSYSWGYGNFDWYGEQLYNWFGNDGTSHYEDYKKPCTPFRGWNFGISLGYRL